jgi:hypothetical protein
MTAIHGLCYHTHISILPESPKSSSPSSLQHRTGSFPLPLGTVIKHYSFAHKTSSLSSLNMGKIVPANKRTLKGATGAVRKRTINGKGGAKYKLTSTGSNAVNSTKGKNIEPNSTIRDPTFKPKTNRKRKIDPQAFKTDDEETQSSSTGSIASSVSQPLDIALGYTDMLKDDFGTPPWRKYDHPPYFEYERLAVMKFP